MKHPIVAVTGSSGSGTSHVKKAFEMIFRDEGINPAIIEGDSFHRYNRKEMDTSNNRIFGNTSKMFVLTHTLRERTIIVLTRRNTAIRCAEAILNSELVKSIVAVNAMLVRLDEICSSIGIKQDRSRFRLKVDTLQGLAGSFLWGDGTFIQVIELPTLQIYTTHLHRLTASLCQSNAARDSPASQKLTSVSAPQPQKNSPRSVESRAILP